MRKIWIVLTILFFYFLLIYPVSARSGCCSGHNGVNCTAGAQANGNVICNDGWTGSSCLYSEMVMCGGSSTSTSTQPIYIQPTVIVYPTNTPMPLPTFTPIPTATLIPTNTPTLTLTPVPTKNVLSAETKKPTPTNIPTAQTTGNPIGALIGLGIVGGAGYWFYKKGKKE